MLEIYNNLLGLSSLSFESGLLAPCSDTKNTKRDCGLNCKVPHEETRKIKLINISLYGIATQARNDTWLGLPRRLAMTHG